MNFLKGDQKKSGSGFWGLFAIGMALLFPYRLAAQEYKAEKYISEVRNAQDVIYSEVLDYYDALFEKKPSVYVLIEKCRFTDLVFFDDVEYYNPKYLDFENCIEELITTFPENPEAIIYYYYNQYDESSVEMLEDLISKISSGVIEDEPRFISLAYEDLARHYAQEENPGRALALARDAMGANDTLDLSALIAEQYIALEEPGKARSILIEHLDSTKTGDLYNKGNLFSDLGEYEYARKVFIWIENDGSGWDVSEELAEVLQKLDRFEEARSYLLAASNNYWEKRKVLEKLFEFDLEHSPPDTVLSTYNLMRNEGFMADPFGVFKFRMFLRSGVFSPGLSDVLFLVSYTVIILLALLIPYFWIVPVYALGKWKFEDTGGREVYDTRWDLKHFWIISSMVLLASFITEIFLDYSTFVAYMNDEYVSEEFPASIILANSMLFFELILAIGTLSLLRIRDMKSMVGDKDFWAKEIVYGVGFIFLLRIVYRLITLLVGSVDIPASQVGYLQESILALIEHYGVITAFLVVVLVAPVIEEIQFRGIMLGSMSKYIPFWVANIVQSALFALVHMEMKFFFFYLGFGIMAGYLRKKTNGYLAPMVFHIFNNLLAFTSLLLFR